MHVLVTNIEEPNSGGGGCAFAGLRPKETSRMIGRLRGDGAKLCPGAVIVLLGKGR